MKKGYGYKSVYISGCVGKTTTYPIEPRGEMLPIVTVPRPVRNVQPMTPVDLKTEFGSALSSNDISLEPVTTIQQNNTEIYVSFQLIFLLHDCIASMSFEVEGTVFIKFGNEDKN